MTGEEKIVCVKCGNDCLDDLIFNVNGPAPVCIDCLVENQVADQAEAYHERRRSLKK